jgi:hypothetical protein
MKAMLLSPSGRYIVLAIPSQTKYLRLINANYLQANAFIF